VRGAEDVFLLKKKPPKQLFWAVLAVLASLASLPVPWSLLPRFPLSPGPPGPGEGETEALAAQTGLPVPREQDNARSQSPLQGAVARTAFRLLLGGAHPSQVTAASSSPERRECLTSLSGRWLASVPSSGWLRAS